MPEETKTCQNCKTEFRIEPEDFAFYEKMRVPPPTFCPECRLQRRLAFYNERILYKRNCDLCGKSMITMFAPEAPMPVYCNKCWWSDDWDPSSYWQDYDSSRPFLSQWYELIRKTPHSALSVNYPTLINSDYLNHAGTAKNCYLIFHADYCENVLYSSMLVHAKDSMDCTNLDTSELCYEDTLCLKCSRVFFSDACRDCHDVYFSRNMSGCNNCFGCANLRNKQYYIFNEPYTKEAYHQKLKEFALDSYASIEALKKQVRAFWLTQPYRFAQIFHSVNVSGDYITDSKNAKHMYQAGDAEDSKYCQFLTLPTTKDSYDYTIWGNNAQRIYECLIVGEGADAVRFSNQTVLHVSDIDYSFWVVGSSYMFGCANIRKKQYCILNKQYTKEDYEVLRAKIIEDMNRMPYTDAGGRIYRYGEFFPPEFSAHAYNETQAMDYFPLTEEQARAQGFAWRTLPISASAVTLAAERMPDRLTDTPDTIINEILGCVQCQRPYRIIPAEIALLRRFGLPVPRRCFYCRHEDRIKNRINPPRLWQRVCGKCTILIETSYAPERPEIVYCEQCYQAEVL